MTSRSDRAISGPQPIVANQGRIATIGALAFGILLALVGCTSGTLGGIDGWGSLGTSVACYEPGNSTALAALDSLSPGHAAPTTMTCYQPPVHQTSTTGRQVYVFTLPDGTQRAVGVWCSVGTTCGVLLPADYYATPPPGYTGPPPS
jgi:hypothetical protein